MEKTNGIKEDNKENIDDYPISADPSMYVTLPVQNEKIWNHYQETLSVFWTAQDVDLARDKKGMTTIFNEEQRRYILQILGLMFTSHSTTVNKELFMQLMNDVGIKEATYYFGSQADMKKTHSMVYSLLLDELIGSITSTREGLIRDIVGVPMVRDFIRWSIQSTISETTESFAKRLLAFASIQGIVFSVPLVLFKWIQKQHSLVMPGLSQTNDLIWRDERLNLTFSCMLFEYIDEVLTEDEAHEIVGQAATHAKNLFTQVFPVSALGFECDAMSQYIEYSADKILSDLKISNLFNTVCPFDMVDESETKKPTNSINNNNVNDFSASHGEPKFTLFSEF